MSAQRSSSSMRVGAADDNAKILQSIMLLAKEQTNMKQILLRHVEEMKLFKETVIENMLILNKSTDSTNRKCSSRKNCICGTGQQTGKAKPMRRPVVETRVTDDSEDENSAYHDPNFNRMLKDKLHKSNLEDLADSAMSQSPVQIDANPPSNIRKPMPKKKEPFSTDYDNLYDIRRAPLPNPFLLARQPQESDFINLMKSLGVETNPSTIQSVCTAVKGLVGSAKSRAPGLYTVIIQDLSDSMKDEGWITAQSFINQLLDGLRQSAREFGLQEYIALVTCCRATGVVPFTNDFDQIRNLLGQLTVGGRTPLVTALMLALCYLDLHGECVKSGDMLIHPRVIIISDFEGTLDSKPFDGTDADTSADRIKVQQQLFSVANKYNEQQFQVICVPVGNKNEPVARELANKCHGEVADVLNQSAVRDVAMYYKYRLCVGRALLIYDTRMKRDNEETDVYAHLSVLLSRVGLGQDHQKSAMAILEKELQTDDLDDIGEDDIVDLEQETSQADNSKASLIPKVQASQADKNAASMLSQAQTSPADRRGASRDMQMSRKETDKSHIIDSASSTQVEPAVLQVRNEALELPRWTHTRNVDGINFEEQGGLPSIGVRVRRGKNWKWGDQDGAGCGTVVGHKQKGIAYVLWDNNQIGAYRFNLEGMYDLQKVKEPRTVDLGQIEVGCCVIRGPDWKRGDEDGGPGTIGVVIRKLRNRYVMVRWPSRVVDTYRFGAEDKWELEVVTDERHSSGRVTPADNAALESLPAEQENQGAESGCGSPWWSFQDKSGQWRPFSEESVAKLESKKEANHPHCIVTYQNISVKCFLDQNQCEIKSDKYPLKRDVLKDDEIANLKSLEQFIPPLS